MTGWFEGFWWSFISMTTVGYGDKTPKSVAARLFSVAWIVMVVALFGIVTGEMASVLTSANRPSEPGMYGSEVGVLRYRAYDAHYAAMQGGVLKFVETDYHDFQTEVLTLFQHLRLKKVDGIVLDKHTLAYTLDYFRQHRKYISEETAWGDDVDFFLDRTVLTAKEYNGVKLAYGIIVRDEEDYRYFRSAFVDNRLPLSTVKQAEWNEREERVGDEAKLFDPGSVIFRRSLVSMVCCLGGVVCFGLAYELRRRGIVHTKKTNRHPQNEPQAL